jgi:hypothetical protein
MSGVKRKAPEEGHRTLGFQISGDGKCTAKKKAMKEKAILFGEAIKSSTMWRGESGMAYTSFYMPSLGDGTTATTLTKKDCEEIQEPVVNAILPKMGIARSAPRAVVLQFGGLGLTHLAALQGHTRLQYLLGHLRCGDAMGCRMQMLLEYNQFECGCHGNPLAQDYNSYSELIIHINWIREVWEHLHTCNATVEVDGLWQPDSNREKYTVIMETLIASGRFTNKELKDINYCRVYLQAFFISDIMNLEGDKIKEWEGSGQKQVGRQSIWEWPIQKRPIAWKAWKTALEYLAPDGHIGNTLGDWRSQHHQITEWYIDAHACTLYHHIEGVWNYHNAANIGRLRFQVEGNSFDEPLQYSHVVEVCERARYMEIVGKQKIKETQTPVTEHVIDFTSGIGESCHTLPIHIQRLVGNIPEIQVPNVMDVTDEQDIMSPQMDH